MDLLLGVELFITAYMIISTSEAKIVRYSVRS